VLFNAGCNEQVFSPINPEKKFAQTRLVVFQKNAKTHSLISKIDITEPKTRMLRYSNNQLKSCYQVKELFQTFENNGLKGM